MDMDNKKEAARKRSLGELGELFALKALVDNILLTFILSFSSVKTLMSFSKNDAKILIGGEINKPTIMEGYFNDSTVLEPHYPVYCIEYYSDLKSAVKKINMMGKESTKGKILELSVQAQGDEIFDYLKSLRWGSGLNAFSMHHNLPTFTLGAAHESVEPRKVIAEGKFFD